jgi:protein O-GlcNAc transferase
VDEPRHERDDGAALPEAFGLDRRQMDEIAALGFQLHGAGRTEDAESIFNGLVALDSHVYYGYAGLGAMALAEEKLDEAIRLLAQAARLNPGKPAVHAELGEALLRQARFEDAAPELARALELDPERRDVGANRVRALLEGMRYVIEETRPLERD